MAKVISMGDPVQQYYPVLAEDLEKQELESAGGVATAQIYGQLLAIYLFQSDLTNAKYLWKRIPQAIKEENPELEKIWRVGQKMWNQDLPGMYGTLSEDWPEHIKPIMSAIGEKTRNRALQLVSKAYSSITCSNVSFFLGLPAEECIEVVRNLGWEVDTENQIVKPKKTEPKTEDPTSSEEQLAKLTEFVSFLEN